MTNKKHIVMNQDFVNKIKAIIANNDKKMAENLLPLFSEMGSATIDRCLFEISTADDNTSFFMLNYLIKIKSLPPDFRKSIVELILDKASLNAHFAILFIENTDVETQRQAVPLFANILVTETDTHILFKVIQAIGNTGEKSCIDLIADFIFYDNNELKMAAVDALEKIGGSSAIKRLAFAGTTTKSDQQILQAIDKLESKLTLGNQDMIVEQPITQFAALSDTLESLEGDSDISQLLIMLNSPSPQERHTAIELLIETGVKAIPAVAENINMNDANSIINGLDILGNINNEAALPPVLKILHSKPEDANVRFAAYEAVSKLPLTDSSSSLITGIEDSEEQVRIAAATAINRNLTKILIAGLQSKIESYGKSSKQRKIVAAIIDSHADKIFSNLLNSDSFVFLSSEYLANSHDSTKRFFIELLNKRGTKTLASNIQENQPVRKSNKALSLCIVDDSDIMLKYYIKFFHNMGHRPLVFKNPREAIKAITADKPDILTSDLNMLTMNGLQLTTQIRMLYNSSELPVVIITTQSDFVNNANATVPILPDGKIASDLHINLVLQKPPMTSDLKPLFDIIAKTKNAE